MKTNYQQKIQAFTLALTASLFFQGSTFGQDPSTEECRTTHERLHGTLWLQASLEYKMLATQSFNLARQTLSDRISDPHASACIEQDSTSVNLPPAVILDVDETVLNNAAFQARLVQQGIDYDQDMWDSWALEKKAAPVPGAIEFVNFARRKGVAIFFVTNRTVNLKEATVENLSRVLGFEVCPNTVMTKNEQEDWTSNKSSRRKKVCETHRVVMMFGDDFNDFFYLGKVSSNARVEQGLQFSRRFGHEWVLLPNPLYGNWEKALYDYDYSKSDREKLELKYGAMDIKAK